MLHVAHAAVMMCYLSQGKNDEVTYVFEPGCHLGAKLAGVHWWFKSRAHAAELTAGYYNTRERDGYAPLMEVLKKYHTHLSFTCVEMRDCEHPPEGRCSPQGALFRFPWCHDKFMTNVGNIQSACSLAAYLSRIFAFAPQHHILSGNAAFLCMV